MNAKLKNHIGGRLLWLEVRDKNGTLKHRIEDVPNIILNNGMASGTLNFPAGSAYAMTSTAENYEDLDGTWNQTGNTITRATGTGTFPTSPSKISDELYWYDAGGNTGHRVHVTARAGDTSITVSGVSKSITGGKLRRFSVNAATGSTSSASGFAQSSTAGTILSTIYDYTVTPATRVGQIQYNFTSAASAYTLGSLIFGSYARVKLPSPVSIEVEDQITVIYEYTETCSGRSQTYELGAESTGVPQKYAITSIVGSGANVDVTFTGATHFLAGDKLDLRGVVPKRFAISSASSDSTTLTINTTAAHGLSVSDSVVIENASVAGYNGTWTVAAVVDADTFEITDSVNPGAMGASGTVRLATPGTYFDDLGLATIASMVSSSVARITSAITGPAVDTTATIGGDPGVQVRFFPRGATTLFTTDGNTSNNHSGVRAEGSIIALPDPGTIASSSNTGITPVDSCASIQTALAGNDWTTLHRLEWNAGAGKSLTRLKQVQLGNQNASGHNCVIQFNTPFNKSTSDRLRVEISKQIFRTLDLTGL